MFSEKCCIILYLRILFQFSNMKLVISSFKRNLPNCMIPKKIGYNRADLIKIFHAMNDRLLKGESLLPVSFTHNNHIPQWPKCYYSTEINCKIHDIFSKTLAHNWQRSLEHLICIAIFHRFEFK